MSRRPSVPAVRAVSCPAECDQFRLASCKVPRPSGAPPPLPRAPKREKERGMYLSRELIPLALRFFHPFSLSPPFSLSLIECPLLFSYLSVLLTQIPSLFIPFPLFLSLSFSLWFPLRGVIAHGSLLGLTHFPPLPRQKRFFSDDSLSRWFSYSAASSFSFIPILRPLILPRVVPFPPGFASKCISLPLTVATTATAATTVLCPLLPCLFFFSLSIAVFCTLRI